jgi:hypothetical protein
LLDIIVDPPSNKDFDPRKEDRRGRERSAAGRDTLRRRQTGERERRRFKD